MEYKLLHNVYGGFKEGIRVFDICPTLRTPQGGGHHPLVLATPKLIDTQYKATKGTSSMKTMATQQQSILPDYQPSIYSLVVSLASRLALLVAGGGFDDTRGTLFFEVARVLKDKRPRHLVLENVKGLLSHNAGKTFQTILGVLADLGYRVEWQVLNSKDFGVPQSRERIYIVGHLGNECKSQILPIEPSDSKTTYGTLKSTYHKGGHTGSYVAEKTKTVDYKQPNSTTRRGRLKINYTGALDTDVQQGVLTDATIRRLTPRECERLQGFPDDWTTGSDTQRYKQCGNAVTVNVVEAVMMRLFEHE